MNHKFSIYVYIYIPRKQSPEEYILLTEAITGR